MTISSTQFQQKVGDYMLMVDNGQELIIRKNRPKGYAYKLVAVGEKNKKKKKKDGAAVMKRIDALNLNFDFKGSSTDYQNHVRS